MSLSLMLKRSLKKEKSVGELLIVKLRPYQREVKKLFETPGERRPLYIAWCRRAGKDMFAFSLAVEQALKQPNSRIMYLFPTMKQGSKAILEGIALDNTPFITSVVHESALKRPRSGSLYHFDNSIKFKNGSTISIVGDDGDALVGSNVNMLVVSEASLVSKETIDYLFPSVLKIGGKIVCVSSPRYQSHFNESILNNQGELITSVLKADEIFDDEGKPVYTAEELQLAKNMMSIERFRSEYLVDLSSHNESSIYGMSIEHATYVDYPALAHHRIFVSLDLGISDNSALTFGIQDIEGNVTVIDQFRARGQATEFYIRYIETWLAERGLGKNMVTVILPHDASALNDSGRYLTSRVSFYQDAGFHCVVLRPISVLRAIELTRAMIVNGKLRFARTSNVNKMLQIIKGYEWKTHNGVTLATPNHGTGYSASNDADSLEYLCIAFFLDEIEKSIVTESGVIIKNR